MNKQQTHFTILAVNTLLILMMAATPVFAASTIDEHPAAKKAVLVTGASTGIGRNIAERLASAGYFVYAGARKDRDIEELGSIENIQGIRLDVTVQSDIDAAVETIKEGGRGLYGIVNNAGVVTMGLLAEAPEGDLDFIFDVNVYGPYRIVKAFTPMIIESKGRITNISSLAGTISGPAYGVYSMSKHAVEAFTDALAREMATVGVHVSAIAPGAFNSKATESDCSRRQDQDYEPGKSQFPELTRELAELCANLMSTRYPEPDIVADTVLHALFSDDPRHHYLAVSSQPQAEYVIRDILGLLLEFSSGEKFGFNRDQLVKMLDEAVAAGD
jgi:NAD(P)-dependent dehydrogenase (short-subunit alcohol dehydrogenase family)